MVRHQPVCGRLRRPAGGPRGQPGLRHALRGRARRGRTQGWGGDPTVGLPASGQAIVAFSGYPPQYSGWIQYRCLGAAALDLCAVAEGVLDGYAVVGGSMLGSWDYLGGMLVCTEAGAVIGEAQGKDLVTLSHADRRAPFAAATPALLAEFLSAAAH